MMPCYHCSARDKVARGPNRLTILTELVIIHHACNMLAGGIARHGGRPVYVVSSGAMSGGGEVCLTGCEGAAVPARIVGDGPGQDRRVAGTSGAVIKI